MNIDEIKGLIPHRYPFLFVDKIVSIKNNVIEGIKNVTVNEPFFMGHFPDYPIMPGVIQVEALAQLGGILIAKRKGGIKGTPLFLGIDKFRFKKEVRPGDRLLLRAEIVRERGPIIFLNVQATVDDNIVCKGELLVGIGGNE